jgi:hypothetical protein
MIIKEENLYIKILTPLLSHISWVLHIRETPKNILVPTELVQDMEYWNLPI